MRPTLTIAVYLAPFSFPKVERCTEPFLGITAHGPVFNASVTGAIYEAPLCTPAIMREVYLPHRCAVTDLAVNAAVSYTGGYRVCQDRLLLCENSKWRQGQWGRWHRNPFSSLSEEATPSQRTSCLYSRTFLSNQACPRPASSASAAAKRSAGNRTRAL